MGNYATPKSDEIGVRAKAIVPGGIMTNFRKSEDYHAVYMSQGTGARLYDVDGNEYIDYCLSSGPTILGHSNAHLRQAVAETAQ